MPEIGFRSLNAEQCRANQAVLWRLGAASAAVENGPDRHVEKDLNQGLDKPRRDPLFMRPRAGNAVA